MAHKTFGLALLIAGLCLAAPAPALANANDNIRYTVGRGDTLISFGQKYLIRADDYRTIQRTNRIANPRAIPVGTVLLVPRGLLKYQSSSAQLASVRGNVVAAARPAATGQALNEGQMIQTGKGSFASLVLENGSRVSLPSNSQLKILRLRRYVIDGSLDYDFLVDRGGARSRVAPLKSPNDRYQVRTPKAVSAVRGTDFQTRFDDTENRDFAEVDEGALAVGLEKGGEIPVASGNGLAVAADGSSIQEAMLPPLQLEGAGRLQKDSAVRFVLPPRDNIIGGFRATVATDAGFHDQVSDLITQGDTADFGPLADGKYFFRARAISANGIQGLPITYAFKRRLNNVKATAGASNDGWAFKWESEGAGLIRYHFQLHKGSTANAAMVDEPALDARQVNLSDLTPGEYFWRVGAVQYADGESNTNWTPFEKIIVSAE
jgi:hypothetical protein